MPSREEFMRQMGLSPADLSAPPPEKDAKASKPRRYDENENVPPTRSAPQVKINVPPPAASSSSAQSRAEFLRSLGIDNFNDGAASSAKPERNATGSQEMPRHDTSASRMPASYGRARLQREQDDEYDQGYSKPTLREMPPDFTLGPKSNVQKGPSTPGLDAELQGLSDSANAEEVKAMGNKYFQAGDYRKAVRLYTRAIELDGNNAALYSNRSAAYLLGSKQMGIDTRSMALRDADRTIKLKPAWFKGFSRRGDALFKLERYEEAAESYESALELDPGNSSIVQSLNEVRPFMIKKKDANVSGSWTAPVNLNSSVSSLSAKKSSSKSAYELLDEFQQDRERNTPQLGRGGNDYKSAQLERFRQRKTGDTNESMMSTSSAYDSQSSPVEPRSTFNSTGSRSNAAPPEFSSDAAREYQASLLEEYRKKKAAKQGQR